MMTVVIDNPAVETYFHHSQREVTDFLEAALKENDPFVVTSIEEAYRRIEEARNAPTLSQEEFDQEMEIFFRTL